MHVLVCMYATGIFIKSTHIDVARMEEVVYNFELSLESEVLAQIQEIQATPDELSQLKAHVEAFPDKALDYPDQFVLDLAGLSFFNDRITCIMFQTKFGDSVSEIEIRLNNIRSCCDFLTTSQSMKNMFAVTLGKITNDPDNESILTILFQHVAII